MSHVSRLPCARKLGNCTAAFLAAAAQVGYTATTKAVATSNYIKAADHTSIITAHSFCEQATDLGEIRMNFTATGSSGKPALMRFIGLVVQWSVMVAGVPSGGVLSAWLSAYIKPGHVVGTIYADPELFAGKAKPAVVQSVHQTAAGPYFDLRYKWLGRQ
ncbi:hypothetical protein SPBR_02096 [Sporothrix brasiliensis 5110]|uniref:Uncharacterized protein n=1 Tax=Sporothrix brasiliensis 5110 TaxID=1398154 RepID=A0A0C2IZ20_9PEZI|nr:uncharacterized protein SPBR_02096 [Sporothrix brasiliensis 5110]KIH91975.1 hypothetical protein SPBR_02096 [Sporothrix brasiliensis 5110]